MTFLPTLPGFLPGRIRYTPPVVSLIVANLVTTGLAIVQGWDPLVVLFIFWAQSLIIGFFSAVSLLFADTELIAAEMGKAGAEAGRKALRAVPPNGREASRRFRRRLSS